MSGQVNIGRRAVIGAVVVLVTVGIAYSQYTGGRAQEQLLDLRASLRLGLSPGEVEALYDTGRYNELTLLRQRPDVWIVNTPMEFGASNWCLHLGFADRSLSSIRVRFVDDPTERPAVAPADVGAW